MSANDLIRRLQDLNLGVEVRTEGDIFIITAFGEDITLNEAGEWSSLAGSSEDPEALIEYVRILADEANTPRVPAGDSSEPEGRGDETSDNNPEGQSSKRSRS